MTKKITLADRVASLEAQVEELVNKTDHLRDPIAETRRRLEADAKVTRAEVARKDRWKKAVDRLVELASMQDDRPVTTTDIRRWKRVLDLEHPKAAYTRLGDWTEDGVRAGLRARGVALPARSWNL